MRNAFGLMAACVVSALLIAAVWYWTASPHTQLASAAPATVAAAKSPAAAKAAQDNVEVTAAIPEKPATPPPAPAAVASLQPALAPCANPNALGVNRVVEVDTAGGPGFGF